MDKYECRRLNLLKLRDLYCDGKNSVVAQKLKRSPAYVTLMLYPEGKAGKKRIASNLVEAIENAFSLPRGWLDTWPSVVQEIAHAMPLISQVQQDRIPESALGTSNRIEKLKLLIEQAGGLAKFARMYEGIDATYLSQLLNGYRNFGEKSARNMEARIGLPPGWFDYGAQQLYEPPSTVDPHIKEIIALLEAMDTQGKIEALGAIKVIAASHQKNKYRKNRA